MTAPIPSSRRAMPAGLAEALGAYGIWGFLPLYFKQMSDVSPWEIVAQRIIWAVLLVLILLAWRRGGLRDLKHSMTQRSMLVPMIATSVLIAVNWLIFLWAIMNGHIVATSLGYFLNPLLNIVLGYVVLKERMRPVQWVAVVLAAVGVAILAAGALDTLWISLTLGASFAVYGLIRKTAPAGPLVGLAIETLILLPVSLGFLLWWASLGRMAFGHGNLGIDALIIGGGAMTAIPLLLFSAAARKLPYSTIGLIQFLAPTISFLIGVFIYKEPLKMAQIACFSFIWLGLVLYVWDGLRAKRDPLPA